MKTLIEFIAAKYPSVWTFTFRHAAGVLRHIPYRPARSGEGEEDGPDWLVAKPSLIPDAGNGLFTTQFCPTGTVLCEYKGTRLTGLQLLRTRNWAYIVNYGFEFFVDAREHIKVKARFVNHNFDASKWNVGWEYRDGRIFLLATRDISAGEELYTDYGDEYWSNYKYWNGWT